VTEAELRVALADADVEVRRNAVLAAGAHADPAHAGPLLDALGDTDWRVRQEAVRIVRQLAMEFDLLPGLIDAVCQGSNVGLRTAAREVLQSLGAAGARAVINALPQVEPNARKFLIDTLVCDGVDEVLSTLVEALRGDDPMNAVSAMDALASLGGPRAEAALRQRLATGETFLRAAALDALQKLEVRVPWSELSPLLSDRVLGRIALPSLGRSGDARAVRPLLDALEDRSSHVRVCAVQGLQRLLGSDPRLSEPIGAGLRAATPQARHNVVELAQQAEELACALAALSLLGCAQDPAAVQAALQLFERSVPASDLTAAFSGWQERAAAAALELAGPLAAHRAAAFSLASAIVTTTPRRGSDAARSVLADTLAARLREAIDDPDVHVQVAALQALGAVGEAADAAGLVSKAQAEQHDIAIAAAGALRVLAARDAAAVAQALAAVVISGAAAATLAELLVTLRLSDALPRLRSALLSDSADSRVAAIAGLSLLGGESAVELVALALNDEDPQVQVAAIDVLPRMHDGTTRAIEALLHFDSSAADVQVALAGALAAFGDPRAVTRLRKLARVGPPGVRVFAMQGLQGLSDPAFDDLLVESLGDSDAEVVKQALAALAAAGGKRSAARIAIALDHAAWDVRQAAAVLLGQSGDSGALAALRARLLLERDALVRDAIEQAVAVLEAR
jgi:HEAT repeat protein